MKILKVTPIGAQLIGTNVIHLLGNNISASYPFDYLALQRLQGVPEYDKEFRIILEDGEVMPAGHTYPAEMFISETEALDIVARLSDGLDAFKSSEVASPAPTEEVKTEDTEEASEVAEPTKEVHKDEPKKNQDKSKKK